MDRSKFVNKALIDENKDLEFSIKGKVIIGKPLQDDCETESIGKILLRQLNNFPDHIGQKFFRSMCIQAKKRHSQNLKIVPILATLFIGAIINSWHHQVTQLAAEYFFKLVQPKAMFAWDEGIDTLVSAAKAAQVDCKFVVVGKHPNYPSLSDLMAEQDEREINQFRHVEPEDPKKQVSVLFFTSGTTSNPKAVMLSNMGLLHNRYNYLVTRTHMNFLTYSTFAWMIGFNFFTTCIRRLSTRILYSEFDAEKTGAVIEKFKVNLIFSTPTMLTQLYKSDVFKKYDFPKLETILVTGNKPSSSILEGSRKDLPNTQMRNMYAMTEANGGVAIQTKKTKTKNSVGRVLGGVQLKIIDPKSGFLLDCNQEGELCYKVDSLMIGYLNNPEETKKVIDDEGWFHSGDLAYYDENGEIWITDRLKHIIIFQADNLSPSKIEEILLQHPGVADVAVVPVPHEIDNERPFAFVVKKPGAEVTTEELKELPASYKKSMSLSGGVTFINEIPYNSNGKKNIKDLKKMAQVYVEK